MELGCSADPLEFGRDLNAARFKDGVRDTPNAQARCPLVPNQLQANSRPMPNEYLAFASSFAYLADAAYCMHASKNFSAST